MKKILFPVMALAAMTAVSCGSGNSDKTADTVDVLVEECCQSCPVQKAQQTKWRLADYTNGKEVVNTDSASNYQLTLNPDSTFTLTTDCNLIGGMYSISEDSISFSNVAITEMACPSTDVEDAFKAILPVVNRYRMPNDSTLLLMSDTYTQATFVPVAE